ncbi:hypothetical protein [Nocardiopsis suaedae]|uniref:Uncharacterized protein n=1 Tax=Nocardiopsis suaedae TaxID=3018444 RepID=A0ABT4TNP9_9ACTN|nr:hypothetical protein [Nocardiopsis suaedae]MDA2806317.1 hypothetical protein [Nocardiopsis suaedae]
MTERTARGVLVLVAGALLVGGLVMAGVLPVPDGPGAQGGLPLAAIDVGLSPALVGGP